MPALADLLDSDLEDDHFVNEDSLISSVSEASDSVANNEAALKKKGKKRRCITMPKTKPRTVKSSPVPTATKPNKKTAPRQNERKVLEPQDQQKTRTGDIIAADKATNAVTETASKKAGRKRKAAPEDDEMALVEVEETPRTAVQAKPVTAKALQKSTQDSIVQELMAFQPNLETGDLPIHPPTPSESSLTNPPPYKRARTESRTRQEPSHRRRAGSASDTERGDPNLRRKLGDTTRKFENIDTKYKNLKEVGISEVNANMEKLRKQCETISEASSKLVASLRTELDQQAPLVRDARRLKKELQTREDEIGKLKASQNELTASLCTAQNEIKALQARVAAARSASASAEAPSSKTPGSAVKAPRSTTIPNGDVGHAAQLAQMKLDLYGDLTGLIVRSVKRSREGDTYECIQTGRNGTLHFKLFIDLEDAKTASFEDTEFLYTPLLDQNRDHDMIELMPPYLREDITFARQNAAKFYQRVVDTLTRRANEA